MACAFAFAVGVVALSGVSAEAKTVKKKMATEKYLYTVGDTTSPYGITNLKINGKSIKKMKSKVKVIKRATHPTGIYKPATYYTSSSAYKNAKAYRKAVGSFKYAADYDYYIKFLKPGTYTITYDEYSYDINYEWVSSKNCDRCVGTTYRYRHTEKYKVVKSTTPVNSVKLGSAKQGKTTSYGAYSSTSTSVSNRFLKKGTTSGKISVSMNKANYSITNILVRTQDSKGNYTYKVYKNGSTVKYSTGKDEWKDSSSHDMGKSLYKETRVYVGYKNKFTGASSTYSIDSDGDPVITERYSDGSTYKDYGSTYGNCTRYFTFYQK
jgi:hypothetical protein